MTRKKIQSPSTINGIKILKDGTIKATVYLTCELTGEEKADLFELENKEGWLLFSPNQFQSSDIPQETAKIDRNLKSQSQMLYSVLFVEWTQEGRPGTFDEFRIIKMEKIRQEVKSRLR